MIKPISIIVLCLIVCSCQLLAVEVTPEQELYIVQTNYNVIIQHIYDDLNNDEYDEEMKLYILDIITLVGIHFESYNRGELSISQMISTFRSANQKFLIILRG